MKFIQCMCCKRTPKPTATEYYIDPKIMLLGRPEFDTTQVKSKISEFEFNKMRAAMIAEGGRWLKATRIFFIMTVIYSIFGAFFGLGTTIYKYLIADDPDDFNISFGLNVCITMLPNILIQVLWMYSMCKSCELIKEFLHYQNIKAYSQRGVNWSLVGVNLMYIQIRTWKTKA